MRIEWRVSEGDPVTAGTVLALLHGRSRSLVSAERTSLNFLQTLSGTATTTARYVAAVAGTGTRILDTRKTLPGLRTAQKYAVRCGGGENHRFGLYDTVMLKENHIRAAGSLAAAVAAARRQWPALPLVVEVEDTAQLRRALKPGANASCWTTSAPTCVAKPYASRPAAFHWKSPAASAWAACVRSPKTAWTASPSAG